MNIHATRQTERQIIGFFTRKGETPSLYSWKWGSKSLKIYSQKLKIKVKMAPYMFWLYVDNINRSGTTSLSTYVLTQNTPKRPCFINYKCSWNLWTNKMGHRLNFICTQATPTIVWTNTIFLTILRLFFLFYPFFYFLYIFSLSRPSIFKSYSSAILSLVLYKIDYH